VAGLSRWEVCMLVGLQRGQVQRSLRCPARQQSRSALGMAGIGEASEDECVICTRWPAALRPAMRNAIDSVPLRKPLCRACAAAFAELLGVDRASEAEA
jgi:hypothetical protein